MTRERLKFVLAIVCSFWHERFLHVLQNKSANKSDVGFLKNTIHLCRHSDRLTAIDRRVWLLMIFRGRRSKKMYVQTNYTRPKTVDMSEEREKNCHGINRKRGKNICVLYTSVGVVGCVMKRKKLRRNRRLYSKKRFLGLNVCPYLNASKLIRTEEL